MIAVDWGTSSFRAFRLGTDGTVLDRRSAALGLLACNGEFDSVLAQQVQGWDDPTIVMAGMIGSRNGWCEVPYVACPAGVAQIAAGMLQVNAATLPGRRVWIAPGLMQQRDDAPPEVMRGEETQIVGLIDGPEAAPQWLCLPGTHSKWVRVEGGQIVALRTAMTGELFALLRRHSLLGALMPESPADDVDDVDAFARGVAASAGAGGVLHHLFGVRTLGLFGTLTPAHAPSYLSGLLVGHEMRELLPGDVANVHVIGGAALRHRYERALAILDIVGQGHGEELGARGLHRLAIARGLAD